MSRILADPGTDPDPDPEGIGHPDTGSAVGLDRLRLLLAGAMGTVIVSYALLVPVAAVVIATGGGGLSLDGAFAAAIPLWLAAHQVPLALGGQPLSVLPLLPTAMVAWVVVIGAGWAVRRLGNRPRSDAGAVLASIAGAHASVAVLGSALLPRAEVTVAPWSAMVGGALVAGAAATIGVLRACGMPAEWAGRFPSWLLPAMRGSAVALVGLVLTGAAVLVAGLGFGVTNVARAYGELAPGLGAGLGVTLLALAYLPNAVLAGMSWALGPGIAVGTGVTTPLAAHPAGRSVFPLLAALPTSAPPVWAAAVFVLPVAVGVLAGHACFSAAAAAERLRAVAAAIVVTSLAAGLLAWLAGGRLGAGPFDPVRLPGDLVVPAVLLWVGVPMLAVVLIRGRRDGVQADGVGTDAPPNAPAGWARDDRTGLERPERAPDGDGHPETGHPELGHPEAGQVEAGHPEAGHIEAGQVEAGHNRAGQVEAGQIRAGQVEGCDVAVGEAVAGEGRAGEDGSGDVQAGGTGAGAIGTDREGTGTGRDDADGDPDPGDRPARADGECPEIRGRSRRRASGPAERRREEGGGGVGKTVGADRSGAGRAEQQNPGSGRAEGRAGIEDEGSGDARALPRRVGPRPSPGRERAGAGRGSRQVTPERAESDRRPDQPAAGGTGANRSGAGGVAKKRWWGSRERTELGAGAAAPGEVVAVPEQWGPRTVAELVALRERQAAQRDAADRRADGVRSEDGSTGADHPDEG
ncbi:DUF6350 family protein [Pseudonocardia sp.]|uniref:cell division protein PerM n=1 Tax=Pseudonocardia sp. TaxID=60912 RepID=UPI0031FC91C0